jgi:hypothetical protein
MKAKELRQLVADLQNYVEYNGAHKHDPTWCVIYCEKLKPRIEEALA